MGAPYTSVAIASYNANPPADDGSQVASNQLTWAKHKTKIGDPLKTAIEAINTGIGTAFGKVIGGAGITTTALTYVIGSSDQGKLVNATAAGITLTTPDATVVTSPFVCGVLNSSSGDVTLDGSGSQTINGSASLTMKAGDGWLLFTDGTNWFVIGRKTGILPRGYIDGCAISNGTDATNDINFAAGVCRDSTNTVDITVAAMAGKQLDANWAPGAAAGMRNSAVGIANGVYHLYSVMKADGTEDKYAHTSAVVATVLTALQAESGGASYVYARRLGSILRESNAIVGFLQDGDLFLRSQPVRDANAAAIGTGANLYTLSVPTGIKIQAQVNGFLTSLSDGEGALLYAGDLSPSAPTTNVGPFTAVANATSGEIVTLGFSTQFVLTDTAGRIGGRASASVAITIWTMGWLDRRKD